MVEEHDYIKFPELTNTQINEFGFASPHVQITEDFTAEVVRVHDGDTITLRTDFRDFDFPLRFLDIDAPELNEGGAEARDWLHEQIHGEMVEIKINRNNRVGKFGSKGGVLEIDFAQAIIDPIGTIPIPTSFHITVSVFAPIPCPETLLDGKRLL